MVLETPRRSVHALQQLHHLPSGVRSSRRAQDLYTQYLAEHWDYFRYSPSFALAFGAFAWMPDLAGLLLWNTLNAAVLFLGWMALPASRRSRKARGRLVCGRRSDDGAAECPEQRADRGIAAAGVQLSRAAADGVGAVDDRRRSIHQAVRSGGVQPVPAVSGEKEIHPVLRAVGHRASGCCRSSSCHPRNWCVSTRAGGGCCRWITPGRPACR